MFVRLGREPDMRLEPVNPCQLRGECGVRREMVDDLSTEIRVDARCAANGNSTVT